MWNNYLELWQLRCTNVAIHLEWNGNKCFVNLPRYTLQRTMNFADTLPKCSNFDTSRWIKIWRGERSKVMHYLLRGLKKHLLLLTWNNYFWDEATEMHKFYDSLRMRQQQVFRKLTTARNVKHHELCCCVANRNNYETSRKLLTGEQWKKLKTGQKRTENKQWFLNIYKHVFLHADHWVMYKLQGRTSCLSLKPIQHWSPASVWVCVSMCVCV